MRRFFTVSLFLMSILVSMNLLSATGMEQTCSLYSPAESVSDHHSGGAQCVGSQYCASQNCHANPQIFLYSATIIPVSLITSINTFYASSLIAGFSNVVERPPKLHSSHT